MTKLLIVMVGVGVGVGVMGMLAACPRVEAQDVEEGRQSSVEWNGYDPTAIFNDIRGTVIHDPYLPPISSRRFSDNIGSSFAALGDWDGDGPIAQVVAVGDTNYSPNDDRFRSGAVYILFLGNNGEILDHRKIDGNSPGAPAPLSGEFNFFGWSLAALGDLDGPSGESVAVLAVGAPAYRESGRIIEDFGGDGGAVFLLYLLPDGSVLRWVAIDSNTVNGPGYLIDYQWYGGALASLGDWDGPGGSAVVLAVGAPFSEEPHPSYHDTLDPAIYFHYLLPDGSILQTKRINRDTPRMPTEKPELYSEFGDSLAFIPEQNGNSPLLISTAVSGGEVESDQRGELYLMKLNPDLSLAEVRILNAESPNAPPIDGQALERASSWYFAPGVTSFQPLLQENRYGIAYLLAVGMRTKHGFPQRIIGLHDDLSISRYSTLHDESLTAVNYGAHGEIFQYLYLHYIGVLDPATPQVHSFAISAQIHNNTNDFRTATMIHHTHIPFINQ